MTMMMGGKVHRTRSKARRSAGGVPGAFLQGVDGVFRQINLRVVTS